MGNDLPDYRSWVEAIYLLAASLAHGADANKSVTPDDGDVYLATDTGKFYVCYVDNVWTNVTLAYLLLSGGTLTGDLVIGANKLKTTNLLLKEEDANSLVLRNAADTLYKNMVVNYFASYTGLGMGSNAANIDAPNVDDNYCTLRARDNGVYLVEIARLVGAADAYFQATLPMVLNPSATPGALVEGHFFYNAATDKLNYRDAAAIRVVLESQDLYTQGARVRNSAAQAIPNATWTDLTFDTEDYDTNTIHSVVTNTNRLTCTTAGKYVIFGEMEFAANATGVRSGSILLNGSSSINGDYSAVPTASGRTVLKPMGIYDLAVNDYVTFLVFQTSGDALNCGATAPAKFMMQRTG